MIFHEYISVKDYRKIGLENKYWFWFFTASKINSGLQIHPINVDASFDGFHPFRTLIDQLEIPVFETKTEDSIDFLISLDPNLHIKNLNPEPNYFAPIILGFNHMRLVSSTQHPKKCFCVEGVLEMVADMNVELLAKLKYD
jgi:hypothetical protein